MGTPEKIFSYGTLQQEEVQLSTFGRKLEATPDALIGYQLSMLKITNPEVVTISGKEFHPVIIFTGNERDEVSGTVFEITSEELAQADIYEAADYKRVAAPCRSGGTAWVYVSKN